MKADKHLYLFLVQFSLESQIFEGKRRENQTTFPTKYISEKISDCEIMCRYNIEPDRIRVIIRRMRFAYHVPKATNTQ
jgi:hypothetical protein